MFDPAFTKDVRKGTKLECYGFSCVEDKTQVCVNEDTKGLYFHCSAGHHYLDGQLNDAEDEYVGLFIVSQPA